MQFPVLKWVGYLEHQSPELLGVFDANVGKGRCTIFAQLLWDTQRVNLMGIPWCATFVHAVVNRPDLLGRAHPGCRVLQRRLRRRGFWRERSYKPSPGDIILCSNKRTSRVDHCGIVVSVEKDTVTSIDGNTQDPSGHFAPCDGGAVALRIRNKADPVIVGYGAIGQFINQ